MNYHISKLTQKCSINKETIRYYEKIGLLSEPSSTNNHYRIYSDETVERIKFIKKMTPLLPLSTIVLIGQKRKLRDI